VSLQRKYSEERLLEQVGQVHRVLIEGFSKKSGHDYCGRNDRNAMVVFPVDENLRPGQYVNVYVERCTPATLIGRTNY
jgi:tRNA-2-methylthio-N6-dimethylallyladenosine synthase